MLEILGCGLSTSAAYTRVFTVDLLFIVTRINSVQKGIGKNLMLSFLSPVLVHGGLWQTSS